MARTFTLRLCSAVAAVVVGSVGAIRHLEGWSLLDASYFTATTIASVGFGDLQPSRPASRALTMSLGVLGTGLLGGLASTAVGAWLLAEAQPNDASAPPAGAAGALDRWSPWLAQMAALLAGGTLGIRQTEGLGWANALYLTFGTLTTAGLGDVVPTRPAAKAFVGCFALVGCAFFAQGFGALALRPLEAARREAQRSVLLRYGRELTEEGLQELAAGQEVKSLGLSADDSYCSRDEFTLLMLAQQAKISAADLAECRDAFDELDADRNGRLSRADLLSPLGDV